MILILLVVVVLLLIVATISGASIAVLLTIAFGLIILIIYARLFSNLLFITTDAIYMGFTERDCPYCKEKVKNTAIKCKHCGSKLSRPKNATKQDTDKSGNEHKWVSYKKEMHDIKDAEYLTHCYASFQVKRDFESAIDMVSFKYKITHINLHEKKVKLIIQKNTVENSSIELINLADEFSKEIVV